MSDEDMALKDPEDLRSGRLKSLVVIPHLPKCVSGRLR